MTSCHRAIWWLIAEPVPKPKTTAALRWLSPAYRTRAQAATARPSDPRRLSRKLPTEIPKTVATASSLSLTLRQALPPHW